jgi:hypothetical protein
VVVVNQAIAEFRRVLTDKYVHVDAASLEPYGWCTIPLERSISAVLLPESVEQIVEIVQIANSIRCPCIQSVPAETGDTVRRYR